MRKKTHIIFLISLMLLFTGCKSLLGINRGNTDFDYLKKGEVVKVIIQSTRDRGFRFVVTDPDTITELYDSLSGALPVTEKSTLEPDYVFEFHIFKKEPEKYYYVAGAQDDSKTGNLYNENKVWHVLNRIDNKIIMNLNVLRKPISFKSAYYGSILDAVKAVRADFPQGTMNLDIKGDREMLKYQMSFEIAEFAASLAERGVTLGLEEGQSDIEAKVVTEGYKTDFYKASLEVKELKSKKTKKYYVLSRFKDNRWDIYVTGTKPPDW